MRIWITGIGMVSPLAVGAKATLRGIAEGARSLAPLSLFEIPTMPAPLVGEVRNVAVTDVAPRGQARRWSRCDAFAFLSVQEALKQAKLCPKDDTVDLIVGGSTAGLYETEVLFAGMMRPSGTPTPCPEASTQPLSSTAERLQETLGPFRRSRTVCSACSSGSSAILLAATWIRSGRSRCVVAGGTEALSRLTVAGFNALNALDPSPCRPFDRTRAGLNLGEGAAFLVLEAEESARRRGVVPIAEVCGWAIGSEGHHITNPEPHGIRAAEVMGQAMERAGLSPKDISFVHAHGTATPLNDAMEYTALRLALRDKLVHVPVASTKGAMGHTLGAAGAFGTALSALAIDEGTLIPTAGLREMDPQFQMRLLTMAERRPVSNVLINAFGFGGTNTTIALCKHNDHLPSPPKKVRPLVVTGAVTITPAGIQSSREMDWLPGTPTEASREGTSLAAGVLTFEPGPHLDSARSRRLDRQARWACLAVEKAMQDANFETCIAQPSRPVGVVLGSPYGAVGASIGFIQRLEDKGPRFVSAADFPNLLPSSPASHASIYNRLGGPALASSQGLATGESCLETAADLLEDGLADAVAVGVVDEMHPIIDQVLAPLHGPWPEGMSGSEATTVVLLEGKDVARTRPCEILAKLTIHEESPQGSSPLPPPASTRTCALVVRDSRRLRDWLRSSAWGEANVLSLPDDDPPNSGRALQGIAWALRQIRRQALDAVLVVSERAGALSAFLVEREGT